jgi:hypothetical protein
MTLADVPTVPAALLALLAALTVAVVAALWRAIGRDADEVTTHPRD